MITEQQVRDQLDKCFTEARFPEWADCYSQGKVRDIYVPPGHGRRILITTDRVSAFDRVLGTIPFKGQTLNKITTHAFDQTLDIAPNHILSIRHPNVMVVTELDMLPVEVVVRGYLTGSTSTSVLPRYERGERYMYGYAWPDGLTAHQSLVDAFGGPIITPTTKHEAHDRPLTVDSVVTEGFVDAATWARVMDIALRLFKRGQELAAYHGLILADTKYEMGRDKKGQIVLADEIHTPDSSRFWIAGTYDDRLANNKTPDSLDKEFLRLWLKERGIGKDTENIPPLDDDLRVDVAKRYMELCQRLTGKTFEPVIDEGDPLAAIRESIAPYMTAAT